MSQLYLCFHDEAPTGQGFRAPEPNSRKVPPSTAMDLLREALAAPAATPASLDDYAGHHAGAATAVQL